MGGTQVYHDSSFLREVWVLFGLGVGIILARFVVRLRTVGLKKFAGDDFMSIIAFGCYTADAIAVTLTFLEGSNVDYNPEQVSRLSDAQIGRVVYGSKMQLVAWYTYVTLIWSLKGCMLFFFNRITFGLSQQTFVKILAVACAATYVAVFMTISLSCRPIHLNWQVRPLPPTRCVFRPQNFYVCTILNVLTDAALLCIPIPMLWKLRVPIRKKITLSLLLSSGIFIITAAIVRICKTFEYKPSALTMNCWGVRETFAAIAAVNAPILKPLFKRKFYSKDFSMSSPTPDPGKSASGGKSSGGASKTLASLQNSTGARKPAVLELINFTGLESKFNMTAPLPALTPPTTGAERHEECDCDSDTIPESARLPSQSTYVTSDSSDFTNDDFYRSTSLIYTREAFYDKDLERGQPWPLSENPRPQQPPDRPERVRPPEVAMRTWTRDRPRAAANGRHTRRNSKIG